VSVTDQVIVEHDDDTEMTVAQSVKSPQKDVLSVIAALRAGHDEAVQKRKPKDMILPGYGEPVKELHVEYRALTDYDEVREQTRKTFAKGMAPAVLEKELGKEMLRIASINSYALIDGQRIDIGLPLGLELYSQLFPDKPGPRTDGEAIVLLYDSNTTVLMNQYALLDRWIRGGGYATEDELGE
jgi:hypothetical protein